ncbi:MAG TPA: SRPBCC domain-containing protein [Anaerolineales bacterium]|nr:SRPBCC domain-containing protein [Anaerolineales bacterium]
MNAEPGEQNMIVTRVFDAAVERVWRAWIDSGLVMRWWGPAGFTSPVARMDFRVGGTSLVCMQAPEEFGGQDLFNTWTYEKIVPMERIEFIQHFSDKDGNPIAPAEAGLPPEIPFAVRHEIAFKALGEGRTELIVTEYGYPSEEIAEVSRSGMVECLDKMAEIL